MDELPGHRHRVAALLGVRAVAAASVEDEREFVGGGVHLAEFEGRPAGGDGVVDVKAEHMADVGHVEAASRDHALRPSRALLGGLEEYLYHTRQLRLHLFEQDRRAERGGGMDVMPAGVHHAPLFGGEGQPRLIRERQRVGVGAQRDRLATTGRAD